MIMKNKRKGLGRGLSSILRNPEINITSKGRGEIDHSTTETKEIEILKGILCRQIHSGLLAQAAS